MRFLRRVSRFSPVICAGVLSAGALGLWSAAPASATSATNETCYDVAQAQPTQAHQVPSASSPTEQSFPAGTTIYGNCNFWNNPGEHHWYMRIYLTNGKNGGVGYIWVQRLAWASQHECFVLGDQLGVPRGLYQIVPSNLPCPLTNIG